MYEAYADADMVLLQYGITAELGKGRGAHAGERSTVLVYILAQERDFCLGLEC